LHQHRAGLAGRLADDGGSTAEAREARLTEVLKDTCTGMANGAPWRPTWRARRWLIPAKCPERITVSRETF